MKHIWSLLSEAENEEDPESGNAPSECTTEPGQ